MEEEVGLKENSSHALRLFAFILFFGGLFLLSVGGGIYLFRSSSTSDEIRILSSEASQEIIVDVDGGVNKPGVYKLSADARVSDAVSAAGGLSSDADKTKVNLASKLSDGQKVYIKRVGEMEGQRVREQGTQSLGVNDSGLVNINTATQAELEKLPKIGPVTAQKIMSFRPYSLPEDLLSKKAVSVSVYEEIRDLVTY